MSIFRHRVMFNCDVAFDVETASAETPLDELEIKAKGILRQVSGDEECCLADLGLDVPLLPAGRLYPRVQHPTPTCSCQSDTDDKLENFTAENCDEFVS